MPIQQDSMRYQGKRRFQQFIGNQNLKNKISFEKVLRNKIGKIVSALKLTKERFLICKKCAKVLCGSFGKENQGFREDRGRKITLYSQGFDWRHKMRIYKLKLGFQGAF